MKKTKIYFLALLIFLFVPTFVACGNKKNDQNNPHQHTTAERTEVLYESTCSKEGKCELITYCTQCNSVLNRVEEALPKKEHDTTTREENRIEATCTTDGSFDTITYCKNCNEELSNEKTTINKLDHNFVAESEFNVKACGVNGDYKISYCLNCKNFLPADKEITLHAHDYERLHDDTSWYFKCRICGHEHRDPKLSLYAPHEFTITSYEAPTCTESGTATLTCIKCGYFYKQYVPALGHDYELKTVLSKPTCTLAGEELHECIRCDKTVHITVAALGHVYAEEILEESKSCVEKGIKKITCERCNYIDYINYYADHQYGELACIQKENCTTIGIYVEVCIVCNHENLSYKDIYHNYGDGVIITAPTCTENGLICFTCTLCGICMDEDIPAFGHEWKVLSEEDPTCTNNGYCFEICTRCDIQEYTDYPALGHEMQYKYNENDHWLACIRCDKIDNSEEHQLETTIKTVETDDGAQIIYSHTLLEKCTICEYKKALDDAKLHIHYAVEIIESTEPSCTDFWWAPGLKCAVDGCDEVLIERAKMKPLGHAWKNCNCTRCAETQLEMKLSDNGEYYIVAGLGVYTGKVLEIPAFYKEKPVEEIAESAFEYDIFIDLILPNTITTIQHMAFKNCNYLENVIIPDGVVTIGGMAFYDCYRLESIVISKSVSDIRAYAFGSCDSLKSITVSDNNPRYSSLDGNLYTKNYTELVQYASGKEDSHFILPNTVTHLSTEALYSKKLLSITLPAGFLDYFEFQYIRCLEIIYSSPDVKVGTDAYRYLTSASTEVHNGKSKIINKGGYLFYTTNGVNYLVGYNGDDTDLVLPDDYNGEPYEIYEYTFYDNDKLTSVTIGNKVTNIGERAFESCSRITNLVINNKNTSIGDYAFFRCDSLRSITLPKGLTNIGYGAFYCYGLVEIISDDPTFNLPENSYLSIPDFYLQIHDGQSVIVNVDDYLFCTFTYANGKKNCLIGYAGDDTDIILPSSYMGETYEIYPFAFYGHNELTSVIIPNGVTKIGQDAFNWCYNITNIVIPDSVTHISGRAFEYCYFLTNVVIGNNVTHIEGKAFSYCQNLKDLTIGNSVKVIDSQAFQGCGKLESVTLGKNVTNIDSAFSYCQNLKNIIVHENNANIKSIDGNLYTKDGTTLIQYAIGKADELFTIPDSVTSIADGAFAGCKNLTSINIPNSVTSIGTSAFEHCSNLESVVIGNSVTSIGKRAFAYCECLTSVVIPDSVTSIGNSAFYNCSNLTSIVIGDSVTSIGNDAFSNCFILESIVIPESVTSIGQYVFSHCHSFTSINYNGTVAEWNAVDKLDDWDYAIGDYTIYCTDGEISKDGTVTYY